MTKDTYYFVSASKGPAEFIGLFRRFYGPTMNAFEAAEQSGKSGRASRSTAGPCESTEQEHG